MVQHSDFRHGSSVGPRMTLLAVPLIWGCSASIQSTPALPSANTEAETFTKEALETPQLEASTPGPVIENPHHVGDEAIHRFSGTFSKQALILKEEVVAADNKTFTVHYTLDEGASMSELLVKRTNQSERIVSVQRINGSARVPATTADYEAMIQKTLFAPDQNHGQLASRKQTCLVGKKEHDCEIADYKVYVADQEARLSVARSQALDRDVSGEIVAVDGTLIYRAELLEIEHQEPLSHTDEVAVVSELP